MNGLVMGVIYALAALGVSLVVGIMNVWRSSSAWES